MLGAGLVAGELCDYVCQWEDFCKTLRKKTVVYFDAFGGTSYPEDCPPKQLYPLTAKQLSAQGQCEGHLLMYRFAKRRALPDSLT